jgi:hypothetical protein
MTHSPNRKPIVLVHVALLEQSSISPGVVLEHSSTSMQP